MLIFEFDAALIRHLNNDSISQERSRESCTRTIVFVYVELVAVTTSRRGCLPSKQNSMAATTARGCVRSVKKYIKV